MGRDRAPRGLVFGHLAFTTMRYRLFIYPRVTRGGGPFFCKRKCAFLDQGLILESGAF